MVHLNHFRGSGPQGCPPSGPGGIRRVGDSGPECERRSGKGVAAGPGLLGLKLESALMSERSAVWRHRPARAGQCPPGQQDPSGEGISVEGTKAAVNTP